MTVVSLRAAFSFPVICGVTPIRLTGPLYPNLPVKYVSHCWSLVGMYLRTARISDSLAPVELC